MDNNLVEDQTEARNIKSDKIDATKLRDDFDKLKFSQKKLSSSSSQLTNEEHPVRYISKQCGNSWRTSRYSSRSANDCWPVRSDSPWSQNSTNSDPSLALDKSFGTDYLHSRYMPREKPTEIPSTFDVKYTRSLIGDYYEKRKNIEKTWIGFEKLEEWSKMDENKMLQELISKKSLFEECLQYEPSGDKIVLVIKILAKLQLVASEETITEIMNFFCKGKFLGYFELFLMKIPLLNEEDRKWYQFFWNDVTDFFTNVLNVFDLIIDTIPTRACDVLPQPLKSLSTYIFENEDSVKLPKHIKTKLDGLSAKLELYEADRKQLMN